MKSVGVPSIRSPRFGLSDLWLLTHSAMSTQNKTPHVAKKVRTNTTFRRPKTLQLPRHPKYARKSIFSAPRMDAYKVLLQPLNTESAMKKIEDNNTLVFLVHLNSNKRQIKEALKKLHDVDSVSVNTLIRYVFLEQCSREKSGNPRGNRELNVLRPFCAVHLHRPDGQKKAYIRLASNVDALDVANKVN